MSLRFNLTPVTGNANTSVAGTKVNGNAVDVGDGQRQKVKALSAYITVLAETNTLTWTGSWEVSNDAVTWVPMTNGPQNAASVAIATGTAGADAAVTRAIPAPDSIYSYKKARFCLTNGVATGAAADTYSIGYAYRTV